MVGGVELAEPRTGFYFKAGVVRGLKAVTRGSEFYGIVIYMYVREQRRPHPRAHDGDEGAVVDNPTGAILVGRLRPRQTRLVQTWAELHRAELLEAWNRASSGEPLGTIEPLP